ncbi:helix-turn-helix domain-containing protein [Brevibacillus fulvus]|uniref:Transcriptional regulator with XRE-family HTH domain n=1 Tax=Brevibacillus fulvus TaxID=1125967 RepID=A0A939BU62_9BACL|nr:helix-turn-helix transcriptional regulator [Brevibacillus fulvus]MBM7592218.1 transcriptional regulator with XRE-family HTH domain [Brevibacillus fulvus]
MPNKFRQRRKELNLKLVDVARQAGISKEYLSQIESGTRGKKMNYTLLLRIAKALETTPDQLIEVEDKEVPKRTGGRYL